MNTKSSNSIFSSNREERLNKTVNENELISARLYNLIMGGVVLYGLIANMIICSFSNELAVLNLNPIIIYIGYLVLGIIGVVIAKKSDNAIISFLGYNLLCLPLGLVISYTIEIYGGINSRPVQMAFIFTAGITTIMIIIASIKPQFFEKLGRILIVCLISLLGFGFLTWIIPGLWYIYSLAGAGLFSLYIGYDFYRSQRFPKTKDNAVDCALDIYLDIVNLFLFLVRIFGRSK